MYSPIKEISHLLMDHYGYEHCEIISSPIVEPYDVMFRSGHIIVLLKNDNINQNVIMTAIKGHIKSENKIRFNINSEDLPTLVMSCLLELALETFVS